MKQRCAKKGVWPKGGGSGHPVALCMNVGIKVEKLLLNDNYELDRVVYAIKDLYRSWPRASTSLCTPKEETLEGGGSVHPHGIYISGGHQI